jgi:hypothetical protein
MKKIRELEVKVSSLEDKIRWLERAEVDRSVREAVCPCCGSGLTSKLGPCVWGRSYYIKCTSCDLKTNTYETLEDCLKSLPAKPKEGCKCNDDV